MSQIIDVRSREVLDSRGIPTVQVDVLLECGSSGRATAPSGASTGKHEAYELRDGDERRYGGKGVLRAVEHVRREISTLLSGVEACEQRHIDSLLIDLDGTENKSRLGANTILATSLAVSVAAANSSGMSLYRYLGGSQASTLPLAMMNILNGGVHADNSLDIQEFMILPLSAPSFSESLRYGVEVLHALRSLLLRKGLSVNVGDEGGFAPSLSTNIEALDLIGEAVLLSGLKLGADIGLALDCAASEFIRGDEYHLRGEGLVLDSVKMVDYLAGLVSSYGIISIEDGMGEDDWSGWQLLVSRLGDKVQLVGDDLFVTNPRRLREGFSLSAANSILVKPNQIGTLSETMDVISMARQHSWGAVVSHRSGESEDSCIADIAVAGGGGQIKCGAPVRSERTAKYNRLLRIEEELGLEAKFIGGDILL